MDDRSPDRRQMAAEAPPPPVDGTGATAMEDTGVRLPRRLLHAPPRTPLLRSPAESLINIRLA